MAAAPEPRASVPMPPSPPPPEGGLPIPSLDVVWTPPSLVAGDVDALAAALAELVAPEVIVGAGLGGREAEVLAGLRGLGLAAEGAEQGPRGKVFGGGPLPIARVPGGSRPRYDAGALALDPSFAGGRGGRVALVVDAAAIDTAAWRGLQAYAVGGCEAPMAALAAGQERSLAMLAPFLTHADAALERAFRAEVAARLPALRAALVGDAAPRPREAFADAAAFERHRCAHAAWRAAAEVQACASGPCPWSPRIFLAGGARIGAALPAAGMCGAPGAALRAIGQDAARRALAGFNAEWSVLADRLGWITEVVAALEGVCAPRRWRFAAEDRAAAQRRLAAIGEAMRSPDRALRSGAWVIEGGRFHAAGIGEVLQIARFAAGPGSVNEEVRAGAVGLREHVLGRARCRGGDEGPVVAAIVDAGGSASFLGYFYAEELGCGEVPALRGEGRPAAAVGAGE